MTNRKVIVVNVEFEGITIYSNRMKVFEEYKNNHGYTYPTFCKKLKTTSGMTLKRPSGFGTEKITIRAYYVY